MQELLWRETIRQSPFGYIYHRLLEGAGELSDHLVLDVNPAFERMTGLSREVIIGRRFSELAPEIRKRGLDWMLDLGAAPAQSELVNHAAPLGRTFKVNTLSLQPGCYVTMLRDVTRETVRIEQLELKWRTVLDLSRDFDLVFNSARDAMFLLRTDGDRLCLIMVNESYSRLTGLSRANLIGKSLVEVWGQELGRAMEVSYRRCLSAGVPLTREETWVLPTGAVSLMSSLIPVVKAKRFSQLFGSWSDITEQRNSEAMRRNLCSLLQIMIAEHDVASLLLDPHSGQIVDANPAACGFYGYSRTELQDMRIQDINALPAAEVARRRMEALTERRNHFLFPHRLKGGEVRMVDVFSYPVKDSGRPLLISLVIPASGRKARGRHFQGDELGDWLSLIDRSGRQAKHGDDHPTAFLRPRTRLPLEFTSSKCWQAGTPAHPRNYLREL